MVKSHTAPALLIILLPFSAAWADELAFTVDEEMIVDGCGGFTGECREFVLEGSLELLLDPENAAASIPAADLRITEVGTEQAFPLELPRAELEGSLDGQTIRIVTPPGHLQPVDWKMTLTAGGLVLGGTFDEGCCDRFLFTFRNVSFTGTSSSEPSTVLLLNGQRFAVEARWTDPAGQEGPGTAVALTDDSGYFWFFDADNTEIVVKVLDACDPWGYFWFFAAGLTDVGVELTVTDTAAGVERSYPSPLGQAFQPILDTVAFATCEVGGSP